MPPWGEKYCRRRIKRTSGDFGVDRELRAAESSLERVR